MAATKTWSSLLLGVLLGAALLGAWLAGWHLLIDAAGLFAPVAALTGVTLWLLSRRSPLARSATMRVALSTAGVGAMALAGAASLSLGALLPAGLAEWASPVLGRFGGWAALLILAIGMCLGVALPVGRGSGLLPHLAAGLGFAGIWVGSQVERQATFPPPPTTASLLSFRFDLLLLYGLLFAAVPLAAWLFERLKRGRSSSSGPKTSQAAEWRMLFPFAIRWALLMATLGLAGSLLLGSDGWYRFALLALALVVAALVVVARERSSESASPVRRAGKSLLRLAGWLVAGLLISGLVFFTTSDDLEIVLLRNNIEWRTMQFWRGVVGDERFDTKPVGVLSGRVNNRQGEPVEGAAVIVSGVSGQVYSGRTVPDGTYKIQDVPAGNYLPMSVAPEHRQTAASTFFGRVATVRPGQETGGINFVLERNRPLELASEVEMSLGQPGEVTVPNPQPSTAVRRAFTFRNGGLLLDGGLVHEPLAAMGPGPFPILLIVYPGEASAWEGVSVPLATNGYVVVSYFPRRLLDLEGDVDDLRVLTSLAAVGRLSGRGDTSRMVLVGGSVSTVYTYLMAREMEGSRVEEQVLAAIQYGGLFDMFRYRLDWEQGKIVIDPGISDLEYLLVAFGRPDSRPEAYVRFSPHYALGPDSLPPTLLVHAGNDIIVPVEQSHITDRELTRLGTPHEFLLYPNIEHYLDTSKRDPTQIDMLNKTLEFLGEHVKR